MDDVFNLNWENTMTDDRINDHISVYDEIAKQWNYRWFIYFNEFTKHFLSIIAFFLSRYISKDKSQGEMDLCLSLDY